MMGKLMVTIFCEISAFEKAVKITRNHYQLQQRYNFVPEYIIKILNVMCL